MSAGRITLLAADGPPLGSLAGVDRASRSEMAALAAGSVSTGGQEEPVGGERLPAPRLARGRILRLSPRIVLTLILCGYFVLGIIYGTATPVFEASDEIFHYPVVKHIADGQGLPVQDPGVQTAWRWEGSQPPLYYTLAAMATAWIDTGDMATLLRYNPHATIGIPLAEDNKNMVVHTEGESFPYHSTVLAVHVIRWLSLVLESITVLVAYLLAIQVLGSRRAGTVISEGDREAASRNEVLALGAAALTAFNPMFLFIAASVNNDNLLAPLCSVALLVMVGILRGGASSRRVWALGLICGLAALTKLSALGLLPLAGLVLVLAAWPRRAWRSLFANSAIIGGSVVVLAGWWYVRNQALYGDPLGWQVWTTITGLRQTSPGLLDLLGEFQGFRISYWGLFGGVNILAGTLAYEALDVLSVAAVAGLVVVLLRRWRRGSTSDWAIWSMLILWVVVLLVGVVRGSQQMAVSQGRYLFPGIAVISLLMVMGLAALVPRRLAWVAAATASLALFVWAASIPFRYIAPAYAQPPFLADSAVLAVSHSLDLDFGDQMRLLGYDAQGTSCGGCRLPAVYPGEKINLTLYWQALQPMQRDYSIFIHLHERTDVKDTILAQTDSYPGGGALPTSLWKKGNRLADTFSLGAPASAPSPALLELRAGLYDYATRQRLEVNDQQGIAAGDNPLLGRIKLLYKGPTGVPLNFQLGRDLSLVGYELQPTKDLRPGGLLRLTLYWRANGIISTDYTSFVHLEDNSGHRWAQVDHQPVNGLYPTSVWDAGEVIRDEYEIALPPDLPSGGYRLLAGMYLLQTLERLPVRDVSGVAVPNNAIPVATVRIAEP